MSSTSFPEDDLFQPASATTTVEEPEVSGGDTEDIIDPSWAGPRCDKCTAPLRCKEMAVCQSCGWYASLGTYVELGKEWDSQCEPGSAETTSPAVKLNHFQVWINLLPWYVWLILGSVAAVLIGSLVVRLTIADTALHTEWSLTQLFIGAVIFGVCHVIHFVRLTSDDADAGIMDFIMKPFKIWVHAAQRLPKQLWFFDAGVMSLAAVIGSLAIIGGIPYENLLDWGIAERPKANLMGAVMDQAKNIKGKDMSMEEAIEELAGKAGVGDMDEGEEEKAPPKPEHKRNSKIDCIILGYRAHEDGTVHTLILAAENYGKLRYAGRVEPELSMEENDKLFTALQAAETSAPFLKVQLSAKWIKPMYTCRVYYAERSKDGRLEDVEWGKMLSKLKFGKR